MVIIQVAHEFPPFLFANPSPLPGANPPSLFWISTNKKKLEKKGKKKTQIQFPQIRTQNP